MIMTEFTENGIVLNPSPLKMKAVNIISDFYFIFLKWTLLENYHFLIKDSKDSKFIISTSPNYKKQKELNKNLLQIISYNSINL